MHKVIHRVLLRGHARDFALDRNATNIGRALDLALALVRADRPTAVVLVSDGLETNGSAANALRSLAAVGVPVVTLPLERRADDSDGWIRKDDRVSPEGIHAGRIQEISSSFF